MANNEVKIILTAVDNASQKLKTVGSSMMDTLKGIAAMAGMVATVGAAIGKIVNETVGYNKSIREMSQVTGLGAEEISRIVQVGDDWGISIEQLRTGLGYMNKQGITPSIETLAQLADEYVNSADKSKFAEKAAKLLGRGYQTLIPLFAKGGKALREQTKAIDENLIATEESIQASRDYEVAMDNLADAAMGAKMAIGNSLVPMLTQMLTPAVHETIDGQDYLVKRIGDTTQAFIRKGQILEDVTSKYETLKAKQEGVNFNMDKGARVALEYSTSLEEVETAADEAATAIDNTKIALDNIQLFLAGPMDKEIENFKERTGDLKEELANVRTEIGILNGMETLTDDQAAELEEWKKKEGEIVLEIKGVAEEHEEATRRIIVDLAIRQAALDGVNTDAELAAIQLLIDKWGLAGEETIKAQMQVQTYMGYINSGMAPAAAAINSNLVPAMSNVVGQTSAAKKKADELYNALEKLDGKHFKTWIDVIINSELSPGDIAKLTGNASGGPVQGNVPTIVGEKGPEIFVPGSSGRIIPNNQLSSSGSALGGGDVYAVFNIYATPGQSEDAIARKVLYRLQETMRHAQAGGGYQGV